MVTLLVVLTLAGIDSDGGLPFVVDRWSAREGLPQTTVTDVREDDRGFLWLTTFGGLARFDGRHFERISLDEVEPGQRLMSLAWLGERLLVGTQSGRLIELSAYGRSTVSVRTIGTTPVWDIRADRQGRLWLALDQMGIGRLELDGGLTQVSAARVQRLEIDVDQRRAWALSDGQLVCGGEGCPDVAAFSAFGLWPSATGRLRVIGRDGEYEVADGGLQRLGAAPPGVSLRDERDRLWQVRAGQLTVDGLPVAVPDSIDPGQAAGAEMRVRRLYRDRLGATWVATAGAGLLRVADRSVQLRVGQTQQLALPRPDGGLVSAGYCDGLTRRSSFDGVPQRVQWPGTRECVHGLAARRAGGLWVGFSGALARLDEETLTATDEYAFDNPRLEPRAIVETDDGVWVGTSSGLVHLTGSPLHARRWWHVGDGLPSEQVTRVAATTDGWLVGTARGAVELHGDVVVPLLSEPAVAVRDFVQDGPVVRWLVTYGRGLARVAPAGVQWFDTRSGLCSDELSKVVVQGETWWVASNRGVFPLSASAREALRRGGSIGCQLLPSGEANGGAEPSGGAWADGRLVFPVVAGVAVVDPHRVSQVAPASLFFDRAWAYDSAGRQTALTHTMSLESGANDVMIAWAAPDDGTGTVHLRHQLRRDGAVVFERAGSDALTLSNLAPGEYQLRAERVQVDGLVSGAQLFSFSVQPRLWERWDVRGAAAGLVVAVLLVWAGLWRSRAAALNRALQARARADAAQQERDALSRALFDQAPGALLLLDDQGRVLEQNPAAQALLGMSAQQSFLSLVADDDRAAVEEALAEASKVGGAPFVFRLNGAGPQEVRAQAGPLRRLGVGQVLVSASDVSAERAAARQHEALATRAATAQRLEGLGRLAAGVAHDFNNVLAALGLQLDELETVPQRSPVMQEMRESLAAGRRLSSRFLVFGRSTEAAPVPLDDALASTEVVLRRLAASPIQLTFSPAAPDVWVRVAQVQLDQVLLNLVVNAVAAVSGAGWVRVSTVVNQRLPETAHQVLAPPAGPTVTLCVSDSGAGMTAQTLQRAFEPFFSTRAQGSGVGLSVVHGVASQAKAGLWVETTPGQGTTVALVFAQLPQPRQNPRPIAAMHQGQAVLVCDDLAPLRRALVRIFEAKGLRVLEAADGLEALEVLGQHAVSLVVTDLQMPRLDGVGLVRALRQRQQMVPVVVLSGHPLDALESLGSGVCYVSKPVSPQQLWDAVTPLLATASEATR